MSDRFVSVVSVNGDLGDFGGWIEENNRRKYEVSEFVERQNWYVRVP